MLCCAGMGDQIKRYCEKLEPEEYEELLDNEVSHSEWTHSPILDILIPFIAGKGEKRTDPL